jgi:hypothetical protein
MRQHHAGTNQATTKIITAWLAVSGHASTAAVGTGPDMHTFVLRTAGTEVQAALLLSSSLNLLAAGTLASGGCCIATSAQPHCAHLPGTHPPAAALPAPPALMTASATQSW